MKTDTQLLTSVYTSQMNTQIMKSKHFEGT